MHTHYVRMYYVCVYVCTYVCGTTGYILYIAHSYYVIMLDSQGVMCVQGTGEPQECKGKQKGFRRVEEEGEDEEDIKLSVCILLYHAVCPPNVGRLMLANSFPETQGFKFHLLLQPPSLCCDNTKRQCLDHRKQHYSIKHNIMY